MIALKGEVADRSNSGEVRWGVRKKVCDMSADRKRAVIYDIYTYMLVISDCFCCCA